MRTISTTRYWLDKIFVDVLANFLYFNQNPYRSDGALAVNLCFGYKHDTPDGVNKWYKFKSARPIDGLLMYHRWLIDKSNINNPNGAL